MHHQHSRSLEDRPPESADRIRQQRLGRSSNSTPLGQDTAEELGIKLNSRDIAVLRSVAGLGIATQEQLQRAYYGSEQAVRLATGNLRKLRMLVRLDASRDQIVYALGQRTRASNVALALDHNGYYLLRSLGAPEVQGWDADRAASVTGQFVHKLCLSELWSYLAAASRATYDYVPTFNGESHPISMSLHWTKEGARFRGVPVDHKALVALETGKRYPTAVKPDALAVLQVRAELYRNDKFRNPYAAPILKASRAREKDGDKRRGNQYTEAQSAWQYALLFDTPAKPNDGSPLEPRLRTLFIEAETGSNSPEDMAAKIQEYNALTKGPGKQVCQQLYGAVPRVLIACRKHSRVLRIAEQWFRGYEHAASTSVLITSLEQLARAEAALGRQGLMLERCWLNVFGHEAGPIAHPTWLSLPEALCIGAILQSAREHLQALPTALSQPG